jgi:hypothetical protein
MEKKYSDLLNGIKSDVNFIISSDVNVSSIEVVLALFSMVQLTNSSYQCKSPDSDAKTKKRSTYRSGKERRSLTSNKLFI